MAMPVFPSNITRSIATHGFIDITIVVREGYSSAHPGSPLLHCKVTT